MNVVAPRLIRQMAQRWYPSTVDVMALTIVQAPSGHETRSHDAALHTDIRAYLQSTFAQEEVGEEGTAPSGGMTAHLDGYYPSITDEMQLLDDQGKRYEIIDVLHHGTRALTRLRIRPL